MRRVDFFGFFLSTKCLCGNTGHFHYSDICDSHSGAQTVGSKISGKSSGLSATYGNRKCWNNENGRNTQENGCLLYADKLIHFDNV
jgi:hypothetical protein